MRGVLALCALVLAAGCTPSDPAIVAERQLASCRANVFENQQLIDCSAIIANPSTPTGERVQALLNRGALRARLGDHSRAMIDFGRALRLDPQNALAHVERGMVHYQRGAYDSAIASYDAALAIQPGFEVALMRREEALGFADEPWRGRIEQLTLQLLSDPTNVELLNSRCWTRAVNNEELDLALADCDAAIARDPRFAHVLDSRGLVNLKLGRLDAALADYEAALAIEPANGHFLYGRGLVRQRMGLKDQATADMRAAEAAEPGIAAQYATYGLTL